MNGQNDRARAHAKQCLLRRHWLLPSDRAILGYWEDLCRIESLTCPWKPDTALPTHLTLTGRGCFHQPGHPSQEFHISSAGASRTRVLTTGSPALYQLSYGMDCHDIASQKKERVRRHKTQRMVVVPNCSASIQPVVSDVRLMAEVSGLSFFSIALEKLAAEQGVI